MLLGKRQAAGEKIRLLVTDVDGVLTDGAIIYDEQGGEIKRFNVQDGAAARLWLALERPLAVISSRQCPAVSRRMEGLGIGIVHQGVRDKAEVLRDIMRQVEAGAEQVCGNGRRGPGGGAGGCGTGDPPAGGVGHAGRRRNRRAP